MSSFGPRAGASLPWELSCCLGVGQSVRRPGSAVSDRQGLCPHVHQQLAVFLSAESRGASTAGRSCTHLNWRRRGDSRDESEEAESHLFGKPGRRECLGCRSDANMTEPLRRQSRVGGPSCLCRQGRLQIALGWNAEAESRAKQKVLGVSLWWLSGQRTLHSRCASLTESCEPLTALQDGRVKVSLTGRSRKYSGFRIQSITRALWLIEPLQELALRLTRRHFE